jgi:outer membrane biosynthesis protein TonB
MSSIRERTKSVSFEQVLETSRVYQRRRPSFAPNDRKSGSFTDTGLGDDKISGVAVHWFDAASKLESQEPKPQEPEPQEPEPQEPEPQEPEPQEPEPQGPEPQGPAKTGSPLATPGNDLPELREQVIVSTP